MLYLEPLFVKIAYPTARNMGDAGSACAVECLRKPAKFNYTCQLPFKNKNGLSASTMDSNNMLSHLNALVQEELKLTESFLQGEGAFELTVVNNILSYLFQKKGKRLRPLLLLLIYKALTQNVDPAICKLAAAVEIIHNATLLHDDVVDESDMRRGQASVPHKWGNGLSVLTGDLLYTHAFSLLVSVQRLDVIEHVSLSTARIAQGEIKQLIWRGNCALTEAQYFDILYSKTGALFEMCAQLPAIFTHQSPEILKSIGDYGQYLGIAFQLQDDILDYFSNPTERGKALGEDLTEGTLTLPLLYILQHGSLAQRQLVQDAIQEKNVSHLPLLQEAIEKTGAVEYTRKQAQSYIRRAVQALLPLPESIYRNALQELAEFALKREA